MPPLNLEKINLEKQQSCRRPRNYGALRAPIEEEAAGLLLLKINLFEIERGHTPNKKKTSNTQKHTYMLGT